MDIRYLMSLIEERFRKLTVNAPLNERRMSLRDEYLIRSLLEILSETNHMIIPKEDDA